MLDRPEPAELLEALAAFLDHEVLPSLEGGRRFRALVAANVARIVAREIRIGAQHVDSEIEELSELLGRQCGQSAAAAEAQERGERLERPEPCDSTDRCANPPAPGGPLERLCLLSQELCEAIDRGEFDEDPAHTLLLGFLKRSVARRLDVDNPKFAR